MTGADGALPLPTLPPELAPNDPAFIDAGGGDPRWIEPAMIAVLVGWLLGMDCVGALK